MTEHIDVLIVGAGLSGIGAARHLQMHCPKKSFLLVERREALGGTWDLFRYPGIRSDSDMHTLGFSFRPWKEDKDVADGADILKYLKETAAEFDIDGHIRYSLQVAQVRWSSEEARWTVDLEGTGSHERTTMTCSFLFMCSGYYNYAQGHTPEFPGADQFRGRIIHPQQWPADLDYAGKQVVVIGSGATAVTLVPALAKTAAHVTMLQRSPTYIFARPGSDPFAIKLKRYVSPRWVARLTRWKNILSNIYFYWFGRSKPEKFKEMLIGGTKAYLGPDYDVATHFTPKYNPWDQRLCMVPDGDLFMSLRKGEASIATDTIERFTEGGVKLTSGKELPADIIVTATGLKLELISGVEVYVDGTRVELSKTYHYKGTMFSGIPNFALATGYTNASWTLKAEISMLYVCRLLNYMDRRGLRSAVPSLGEGPMGERPMLSLTSGYVQRALDHLPKQGLKKPWALQQNYARDLITLRYSKLNDGALRFSR